MDVELKSLIESGFAQMLAEQHKHGDAIAELKADVSELKADVSELKSDVSELKSDVSELKAGQAKLDAKVEAVEEHLHNDIQVTRREMASGHLRVMGRIDQLSDQLSHHLSEPHDAPPARKTA